MDEKSKILDPKEKEDIEKMLECCGNDRKWDKVYLKYVLKNALLDDYGRPTENCIENIFTLLIAFGMGRQLKYKKYPERKENFKKNLKKAFDGLQNKFEELKVIKLENFRNANSNVKDSIKNIYLRLSNYKKDQKDDALINGEEFCVGATKIMHFLFPHLLIMIDSIVRKAVEKRCEEELRRYEKEKQSAEEYIKIMEILSTEITNFEPKKLEEISSRVFNTKPENKLPVPRIMDKILFMIGDKLGRQEETSGD